MIRYLISAAALKKLVVETSKTWLTRAKQLTVKAEKAGKAEEGVGIWSEIKPVFLGIQGNKCIYCERLLPSAELGLVEHDVEHYRPKNRVQAWPAQKDLEALGLTAYPFGTGPAAPGYVSLAFDISNYAAACKTCNSSLKADRFPIAGKRATKPFTAAKLKAEKPYLPLPLASKEDDPEALIGFNGILPYPLDPNPASFAHRRARVTIDFFRLASPTRESDLLQPRLTGCALYASKWKERSAATIPAERTRLDGVLTALTDGRRPHASCVRAYARLCTGNPAKATEMAALFDTLVERGVRELFQGP